MEDIEATIRRTEDDNEKLRHCRIGLITMKPLIISHQLKPMTLVWSDEALMSWDAHEWVDRSFH